MNDFLAEILAEKKEEVRERARTSPLKDLKSSIRSLPVTRSLSSALRKPGVAVIAEVKKASPSAGVLTTSFNPRSLGQEYEQGGAAALSVLTDAKFFQGSLGFLKDVRSVTTLPVLRKDFVIDEYQIYETRSAGGDALLLIARILDLPVLKDFYELAGSLGLQALVEVHDEKDIEKANRIGAAIIGINNRDLSDFSISLDRSLALKPLLHGDAIAVSESGIRTRDDVQILRRAGFDAVLVGEGLVRSGNRVQAVRDLMLE